MTMPVFFFWNEGQFSYCAFFFNSVFFFSVTFISFYLSFLLLLLLSLVLLMSIIAAPKPSAVFLSSLSFLFFTGSFQVRKERQ